MKKTETLIERACREVAGFSKVISEFEQKIVISGGSQSTVNNYSRKIAECRFISVSFRTI